MDVNAGNVIHLKISWWTADVRITPEFAQGCAKGADPDGKQWKLIIGNMYTTRWKEMIQGYDFECFLYDWLVVIINPLEQTTTKIANDPDKLKQYYDSHKDQIWIGYNSRNYDQYIMKAIMLGMDPWQVNEWIITKGRKGWEYSSLFNTIQLYNYDCSKGFNSLKQLEGFMGNSVKETGVPFDIRRKLTDAEIQQTFEYCQHDVEQTLEVFLKTKNEFDAQISLLKAFDLPMSNIGKTQAQLAAIILGAVKQDYLDDWEIRVPKTMQLNKYKFIADWFLDENNHDESKLLNCTIADVDHVVAWGGLHGAIPKFSYTCKSDEMLIMADVDQLYPTLMIKYKLLSRAVKDYGKFEHILSESLRLKALKKKKEREPYKRICNITYGSEGDPSNAMYDPLHRKLVCIYGQLLMVDLIEKIESFVKLVQSNTDGILILIKEDDYDRLDDAVYEWEERTGLHMSFDNYKRIIQKDVNNYIAVDYEGNIKTKGAFVKPLNDLDNDLPIVNKALVAYMVDDVPVEQTINACNELKQFQKIVKVSSKYICGWHNGHMLQEKTFRVFADKTHQNSFIGKLKMKNKLEVVEKFANTPDHCFIVNDNVNGVPVPDDLDRQYYIDVAKKRLEQFGVG